MERKGYIYMVVNQVNGKRYVGQTIQTPRDRMYQHVCKAKRGCKLALHCAMRKHGVDSFYMCELACVDRPLLNELEQYYIEFFGTLARAGYNVAKGGNSSYGYTHSAKTLARMSASSRRRADRRSREEYEEYLATRRTGVGSGRPGVPRGPISAEHKRKLSISMHEVHEARKAARILY